MVISVVGRILKDLFVVCMESHSGRVVAVSVVFVGEDTIWPFFFVVESGLVHHLG